MVRYFVIFFLLFSVGCNKKSKKLSDDSPEIILDVAEKNTIILINAFNSNYTVNTKYISTDLGESYFSISFPNTGIIQEIAISGNNILIREDGPDLLYFSDDGGSSFSTLTNPNNEITGIVMSKDIIILNTFNTGFSQNTYYISNNKGQTFSQLNIPAEISPIQKIIIDSGKIYIQESNSNVFAVSVDNGLTYEIKTVPNQNISELSVSEDKIVVDTLPMNSSTKESYVSLDGGDNYQLVDLGSKINSYQKPYYINGKLFITGAGPIALSISEDDGESFTPIPIQSKIPEPNITEVLVFGE